MHRSTPRKPVRADSGEGRQIGLDDREIPGGLPHIGNAETHVTPAVVPAHRHVPSINEHRVEDLNPDAPYENPEAGKVVPPHYTHAKPEEYHAVPTYLVQHPSKTPTHLRTDGDFIPVPGNTGNPIRLCSVDYGRAEIQLMNEDAANDVRVAATEADLVEGRGSLLKHGATSYTRFKTQDVLYALGTSGNPVIVSIAITTAVSN